MVLFDTSIYRYPVKKFQQVALSGSAIVSDIPLDNAQEYRSMVLQISMADTDDELVAKIAGWAADPALLRRKAEVALKVAREKWTCHSRVDLMLHYYEMYQTGSLGVHYQQPFTQLCPSPLVRNASAEFNTNPYHWQAVCGFENHPPNWDDVEHRP